MGRFDDRGLCAPCFPPDGPNCHRDERWAGPLHATRWHWSVREQPDHELRFGPRVDAGERVEGLGRVAQVEGCWYAMVDVRGVVAWSRVEWLVPCGAACGH